MAVLVSVPKSDDWCPYCINTKFTVIKAWRTHLNIHKSKRFIFTICSLPGSIIINWMGKQTLVGSHRRRKPMKLYHSWMKWRWAPKPAHPPTGPVHNLFHSIQVILLVPRLMQNRTIFTLRCNVFKSPLLNSKPPSGNLKTFPKSLPEFWR